MLDRPAFADTRGRASLMMQCEYALALAPRSRSPRGALTDSAPRPLSSPGARNSPDLHLAEICRSLRSLS